MIAGNNDGPMDIKFVIADKNDLNFAMEYVDMFIRSDLFSGNFVFSPVDGDVDIYRMLIDTLPAYVLDRSILCMQIHKMVGLP